MPQLNPAPWLPILIFSWMVFLVIIPPKIMAHMFLSQPTSKSSNKHKAGAWNWVWP